MTSNIQHVHVLNIYVHVLGHATLYMMVQVFQLISSLAFSSASKLFETPVISNRAVTHKQTCNSPNACTNWTLTCSVFFRYRISTINKNADINAQTCIHVYKCMSTDMSKHVPLASNRKNISYMYLYVVGL